MAIGGIFSLMEILGPATSEKYLLKRYAHDIYYISTSSDTNCVPVILIQLRAGIRQP